MGGQRRTETLPPRAETAPAAASASTTPDRLWRRLGAHPGTHEGASGVRFAVWAPRARRVSVLTDLGHWSPDAHPLQRAGDGVWRGFVPGLAEGALYKYAIVDAKGRLLPLKADPVGFGSEHPPATASVVRSLGRHEWADAAWLCERGESVAASSPLSVYEVHLGSWRRTHGRSLSYLELAEHLVDYAQGLGFTHVEILPISEHPFDGSWGYQPIGLFAPTIRHGTPEEFAALVDAAHARGLGVIADWVPGHFPTDEHGLGRFDGTPLYEYADPREGFHPDWNTLIFNYARPEVRDFLIANALYWLEEYHLDGLRVDAVASMLYRDYSRKKGQWIPNRDGGTENYEAIEFLRQLNEAVHEAQPTAGTFAEESTAFPRVTGDTSEGGLGFSYKWNLGWMNDSLRYFGTAPGDRAREHDRVTFGATYAFSERFILPLSHDEVVHGKGSLYGRMPGSHREKLANLRALYGYTWGYPGKKLLFMGQEFGQRHEWDHDGELDWALLDDPGHAGVHGLVRDLNRLYRAEPALHRLDADGRGFEWLIADARRDQVFAWLRRGEPGDAHVLVVLNLSATERRGYRIPFPTAGRYREALNTDSRLYGGGDRGHGGAVETEPVPLGAQRQSALLTLPALSAIFFVEEQP